MIGQQTWMPYCGTAPLPGEWLARWNLDPILLLILALMPVIYARYDSGGSARRRYAFWAAWILLALLFVSPLCALSSALFTARVLHHVLLTAVAAPLLVLAVPRTKTVVPGSLPAWTALHALVFWSWHSPALYALALSSDLVYWLMQTTLMASAAGFWTAVLRSSPPAAVAALLATTVQMGLLGALITFAGAPLYAPHFASTIGWGLAPLEDQQLAGLIMWVPAAGIYLAAGLLLAVRWLGGENRATA